MDTLRYHNGKKITAEIEHRRFARAPHRLYSPGLSPCDFWLFGLVKHSLKDREIQGLQALISALRDNWDDLIFEDVQAVFLDWMERLSWVINNNGDCYFKRINGISNCPQGRRETGCSRDFHAILYHFSNICFEQIIQSEYVTDVFFVS
jgi:hypothetical protein